MHVYFLLVLGDWKFERGHLWRLKRGVTATNGRNPRNEWRKVI